MLIPDFKAHSVLSELKLFHLKTKIGFIIFKNINKYIFSYLSS